jgi:HlyD family secretion protein
VNTIGYIDSTQLYLKKKQLETQIKALLSKKPNISVQLSALQSQLATAEKEKIRIANLVKGDAATTKQLDDINANIEVIKKQIEAQKSSLEISSEGIGKDATPIYVQIEQLNDQLAKCNIINPINGTVLTKYSEVNEMTSSGKALYKIADLSTIILRAYITGNQLPQVKLNQKVKVNTDDGKGGFKETEGTIIWINDKSEFTPKTIQTKDERANMVYAVKVKVVNDRQLQNWNVWRNKISIKMADVVLKNIRKNLQQGRDKSGERCFVFSRERRIIWLDWSRWCR